MVVAKVLRVLFTWLGIEILLATYCLQYGLMLVLIPQARYDSVLTTDLAWQGYGWWLGIPFLVKTLFTASGTITNLRGWRYSWVLRFIGASVGCTIWLAMFLKYTSSPVASMSFSTVVAFDCMVLSALIVVMAYHDFPEPRSATDAGLPTGLS